MAISNQQASKLPPSAIHAIMQGMSPEEAAARAKVPDGYTKDNGHGMPTHLFSRKSLSWIPTPKGYARDEGRATGKTHCRWRGEWHETPTMDQLSEWCFDSVCETPDGETVEPDHPESWLSILGMI